MINTDELIYVAEGIYTSLTGSAPTEFARTVLRIKIKKLVSLVKEGLTVSQFSSFKEALCYTAVLMTALDLSESENALYQRPIRVGDISFKAGVESAGLKALVKENMKELSPILKDTTFIFEVME